MHDAYIGNTTAEGGKEKLGKVRSRSEGRLVGKRQ